MENRRRAFAAVIIGSAVFFILGRFLSIPSPVQDINISFQYGFLAFISCIFGSRVGCLIGLIGHTLIDLSYGWGIWWSWIIASGVAGLFMGYASRKVSLNDGSFTGHEVLLFNFYQIVGNICAWLIIAPCLDLLIYAEPAKKTFVQGFVACLINIINTAWVGGLSCMIYAKTKNTKNSLKEDEDE